MVEGTARITSCCFASRATTELMPPDARQKGDKLSIYFALIVFGIGFIVLILLLFIIKIIEFIFYVRYAYRLMKRIDQDPWNILDAARALDVTPMQVRILYTNFCEVRNSWRSLINRIK